MDFDVLYSSGLTRSNARQNHNVFSIPFHEGIRFLPDEYLLGQSSVLNTYISQVDIVYRVL